MNWKITGFIATVVIVLAFPLYIWKALYLDSFGTETGLIHQPQYVGSATCVECHKIENDLWLTSDHYFAMDTADEKSVLGDFNNVEFKHGGETHRLYKKDEKFFAFTDGSDGKMQEFEVQYTFGAWPLQQYLVPFPDGKMQTLALTWDTIKKEWYHMADVVYQGQDIDHTNWLHWTNQGQNWNGMCADCHSTNLVKGFDHETKTFQTTWSEINVGCEACHGASSEHLKWANLPELSRPANTNFGLIVQTSGIDNRRYIDLCARCHTRRSSLEDYDHNWSDLLDNMIPALAHEPFYYPDGQILEEDYVYGSFVQSKMYMNDVQCNDCHNVHSGKLILQGNDLCLQCHRKDTYDTYSHHFHKYPGEQGSPVESRFGDMYQVGDGASCINCHMPGRYYMGVDYRRDHSFRIPRPELSDELGTPNSCTYCHADKSNQWAAGFMTKWYGQNQKSHYGSVIASHLDGSEKSLKTLKEISADELYPPHLRATALYHLSNLYPDSSRNILISNFTNIESIIRHTAVSSFTIVSLDDISKLIPLLNDPVKAVRMDAAIVLAGIPEENIPELNKPALKKALEEYREAMEYSSDFAASRHNLGNFYSSLGENDRAVTNYIEAIRIDDGFFPAKVNLAMMYNRMGENEKAKTVLKNVVEKNPEQSQINYSLGLLLAEMQEYDEAIIYLQKAAELMPDNSRAHYNLGQLLDFTGATELAGYHLKRSIDLEPENLEFLMALAEYYLKHEEFEKAKNVVLRIKELNPDDPTIDQIIEFLDSKTQQ